MGASSKGTEKSLLLILPSIPIPGITGRIKISWGEGGMNLSTSINLSSSTRRRRERFIYFYMHTHTRT